MYLFWSRQTKAHSKPPESRACHLNSMSLQCCTSKGFVRLNLAGRKHKGGSLFTPDKCAFICGSPLMYRETLVRIPSQTNAWEIPLLCIILNNSIAIHCRAFIPFKAFILNFVPTVCLSTVMGILVWLFCAEGVDRDMGACSSARKKTNSQLAVCFFYHIFVKMKHYNSRTPFSTLGLFSSF